MRVSRAAVVIAALVAGIALQTARPAAGDSISSQQAQIRATRDRLDGRKSLLGFETVRAANLRRQLAETDAGIARAGEALDGLQARIRHTERNLAWNRIQLDAAEATLARHNDALRRRLVDAYERGDLGYIEVMFASRSFNEFVERWEDIRYLIAANERTVRERREAQASVARARDALEREEFGLRDDERREQQTKFQLAALAAERVQLVAVAEAQRAHVATEVARLEDLTAAQEAALERLIRERQRQEAARRAAEEEQRRRAAQLAGEQAPPPANTGAPGSFSWPASGPITSPFGMRSDPLGHGFRMHTGVDIGAPMGSTITAAATGRVIFAGWYGGYGNAVIIDHGGQTSTLYGHCSQIFVANGQDVERGQAIAAVGSTGESTGPHLHFEVRINGIPVEPTSRLR